MGMVDLKVTKADLKKDEEKMMTPYQEDVPYGLSLHLSDREIGKLGLKDRKLDVGGEMEATVKLRVTSVNDSESEQGGKQRNVSVAVIGMDIGEENKQAKRSTVLFGGE